MERYCVRISSRQTMFSAGHFIAFGPDECERLHGHNYRVGAEVHGPLDENQCVVDFIALRDTLAEIVAELDHRMLLPAESSLIHVVDRDNEIEVRFADRRWVFPCDDCRLLPLSSTTAERLARYVGEQLRDRLESRYGIAPTLLRIEVEESPGLSAICELS